jgi:hypothetical protein
MKESIAFIRLMGLAFVDDEDAHVQSWPRRQRFSMRAATASSSR